MQSTILSIGISEAYSARRDAQRVFSDSPAFLESDRRLARTKENAAEGRGSQSAVSAAARTGFSVEPTPEQRKEADVIRRGDTRIRPYESAYLARNSGALTSGGNFLTTYGADGKLSLPASRVESVGKPLPRTVQEARQAETIQQEPGEARLSPATSTPSSFNASNVPKVPDAPSVTEAGKSLAPPPRDIAEAQMQEKIQTALESRTEREIQHTKRTERTEAAASEARRNGETANVEQASPSEMFSAIVRQRLVEAYQTVPRDAAATVSLFV